MSCTDTEIVHLAIIASASNKAEIIEIDYSEERFKLLYDLSMQMQIEATYTEFSGRCTYTEALQVSGPWIVRIKAPANNAPQLAVRTEIRTTSKSLAELPNGAFLTSDKFKRKLGT